MRTFISRTKEHGASIAIRKTSTYMRAHADTMDSSCTANLCLLFRDWYLHFKKRQLLPRTAAEEVEHPGIRKGVAGNEVVREKERKRDRHRDRQRKWEEEKERKGRNARHAAVPRSGVVLLFADPAQKGEQEKTRTVE